eukprot:scaffold114510_cov27-Tisochrysis_lutea.AAC.3
MTRSTRKNPAIIALFCREPPPHAKRLLKNTFCGCCACFFGTCPTVSPNFHYATCAPPASSAKCEPSDTCCTQLANIKRRRVRVASPLPKCIEGMAIPEGYAQVSFGALVHHVALPSAHPA